MRKPTSRASSYRPHGFESDIPLPVPPEQLPETTPADRASAAALMTNRFAGEAAIPWGEQIAEGSTKHRALALASQAASYTRMFHHTIHRVRACDEETKE